MDGRTTTLRNIPLDTKIATLRENLCRKASICDDSLRLVCGTKVFQAGNTYASQWPMFFLLAIASAYADFISRWEFRRLWNQQCKLVIPSDHL
jgi:hypothetical protein